MPFAPDAFALPLMLRTATSADQAALQSIADAMGARHESGYFERCLQEQAADRRRLVLALDATGRPQGYVQLVWRSTYAPFRRLDIPEIQDLNVVPPARRQGIGMALVAHCEGLARAADKSAIGLAVGLHAGFGAAQRLYARLGYSPDGEGVCYDDTPVKPFEIKPVDDHLTLRLIKPLAPTASVLS